MKSSFLLSNAAALVALACFNPVAMATPIDGTSSGLTNPSVVLAFDPPPPIATNAPVTTQYADRGVTFSTLYYNPYDPDNQGSYPSISGNYLGNYQNSQNTDALVLPDFVPLTITFSDIQTQAAFGLQSNGGDGGDGNVFTFTAYLADQFVESFTASVASGYYGFTDSQFDSITVASCIPNDDTSCGLTQERPAARSFTMLADDFLVSPDYYLFDNLQFGVTAIGPSAVPEPATAALLGLALFGAAAMRRRRSGPARTV